MPKIEDETTVIRTLHDGQLAIPERFLAELGINEQSLLELTVAGGELRLKPVPADEASRGSSWLRELYTYFAPVREEAVERGYTEDQINRAIDEAIAAVRTKERRPG